MSRLIISLLNATVVAVSITSAAVANAQEQHNPLHPSYYARQNSGIEFAPVSNTTRYVDARNPLHPSYARGDQDTGWQPAQATLAHAYADTGNPLHPAYRR